MAPGDQRGRAAASRSPKHRTRRNALVVAVVDAGGRRIAASGLRRWLAGVAPASAHGSVTVALASDARVRALNREYRRKDYATDVLSFPAGDEPDLARAVHRRASQSRTSRSRMSHRRTPHVRTRHLGDIVIAMGVARRQAREAGHSADVELKLLALHGLLHLLGYDHEDDDGRMARAERRLRRRGGLREGLIERARA